MTNTEYVTVRYDLSSALVDEAIRSKLIELGWIPPDKAQALRTEAANNPYIKASTIHVLADELLEALKHAHTWLQGSEPGRAQYLGEIIAKAEGQQ